MTEKIAAVAYVRRGDSQILVVRNPRHDTWAMPGGLVEDGETYEKAVARELLEESSLVAKEIEFVGEVEVPEALRVPGRATRVRLYRVTPHDYYARQREPDAPVAWWTHEQFLARSKFADIYRDLFVTAGYDGRTEDGL